MFLDEFLQPEGTARSHGAGNSSPWSTSCLRIKPARNWRSSVPLQSPQYQITPSWQPAPGAGRQRSQPCSAPGLLRGGSSSPWGRTACAYIPCQDRLLRWCRVASPFGWSRRAALGRAQGSISGSTGSSPWSNPYTVIEAEVIPSQSRTNR
jgi:hypothetical protein